jgi:two-component system response regulator YesN
MAGLLLVEDEEAIQQKLVHNTNWREYGFDRVYAASNGVEALAILEQNQVEIMVTDIQMPEMNGLQLLKECKNRNYNLKTIVISGFAEFEYAQEAIKLGVADYLLKPFASKKLLGVILKLKEEIEQEQSEQSQIQALREQLQQNIPLLQDKLFLDLINGNLITKNPNFDLKFLGLDDLEGRDFMVVVVEIPENQLREFNEEEKYLLNLQLHNQIQQRLGTWDCRYRIINNRLNQITVIVFNPGERLAEELEELINQLQLSFNQPLTIGMGHCYHELKDVSISYREACVALQYRYLYGANRIFSINDINRDNPYYHKYFYNLHKNKIFDDLRIASFDTLQKDLAELVGELREAQLSPESLRIIDSNIMLLTCTTLNELGYGPNEILGQDLGQILDVNRAESLEELEQQLLSFFALVNDYISKKRTSLNENLVDEVRRFLDENYTAEITLSGIAAHYNISPSYLSLLFTERTKKNFIDYLTERRIKKAKELLKHSDLKIYEIANAVGYNDSFYFSNCFKKIVGMAPSEYREKVE